MKLVVVLFCCSILIKDVHLQAEEGDACIDNANKTGICKPADQCSAVIEDIKRKKFPKICGYKGIEALVCCENSTVSGAAEVKPDISTELNSFSDSTRIPGEISKAKCKEYAKYSYRTISSPLLTVQPQYEKVYDCRLNSEILAPGSLLASIEDYPYMAHIGFEREENDTEKAIEYICAGSLISENFVLTVAHCINQSPPVLVRFGVANVNDYKNRQEIKISEFHIYPNYTRPYNDIGLIKLEKPAVINQFVRPACLNTVHDINYRTAVVAGWGQTYFLGDPSDDLLKSVLSITSHRKCNDIFKREKVFKYGIVEDLMICAEISNSQRKDPCQGDSGSALQVSIDNSKELQCMSLVIGLTSAGKACGFIGIPGIYTRVSGYIGWIEQIVWPDNI